METQPRQNDEETLEYLFVRFARTTLALMETWVNAGEVPQSFHQYVQFGENGLHIRNEIKKDYFHLLWYHHSHPFWTSEETTHCIRNHWEEWKQFSKERNFPDDLTPEQIRSLALYELVFPIFDVLEQTNTFQPTEEQLLASYGRFRKRWTTTDASWVVIIPLLQFACDFQQAEQITSHLQLTPFTMEEKEAIWNQTQGTDLNLRHSLDGSIHVDIHAFRRTEFKLSSTHIKPKNGIGAGDTDEIAEEVLDILAALRL